MVLSKPIELESGYTWDLISS